MWSDLKAIAYGMFLGTVMGVGMFAIPAAIVIGVVWAVNVWDQAQQAGDGAEE